MRYDVYLKKKFRKRIEEVRLQEKVYSYSLLPNIKVLDFLPYQE